MPDKQVDSFLGTAANEEDWVNTYKKMVGMSLAGNCGYWHYEMWGFFQSPVILRHIKEINEQAKKIVAAPPKPFHPDVALVLSSRVKDFESVYHNVVSGAIGYSGFNNDQEMMLETSGVPYDRFYLNDILSNPELQNYKVYIFMQNTCLTDAERKLIDQKLKKGGRTIVWVYDTGYISEKGPSVQQMSDLIGMNIATEERFERLTPLIDASAKGIGKGLLQFQSSAELMYANFRLKGLDSGYAPGQPFWIDDNSAQGFAAYRENGKTAMAVRKYPGWTSVYLAAPDSLGNDLMNNIARIAGAYVCVAPGIAEIHTNGNFVTLHGMKSGTYEIILPKGRSAVVDLDTGKSTKCDSGTYMLKIQARKTYWLMFR